MRRLVILLLAGSCALPATAQERMQPMARCADAEDMRATLLEAFGEKRRFAGMIEGEGLIELFSGPTSWSLTMTTPDGQACLIAAGYAHFLIPPGDPA